MANANDFFGAVGNTISRAANKLGKKTDQFVTVQKIRSRQHNLEDQIEMDYRKMGEWIFQKYTEEEELPEKLQEICRGIEKRTREIRECRERIAQVKGAKICPGCGELIPKDANYCMNCDTSFQKVQQEGTETEPDEPRTDTQEE